jgi:VWFA-related protein
MSTRHAYLNRAVFIFLSLFLSSGLLAQDQEKPKLKDFGSSLKTIKTDPGKKTAVDLNSKSGSKSDAKDIEIVKVETSLVSNDVLVLDSKGNFVAGLTGEDFVVTEDGQPQPVGMFSMGDNLKVSRTIVLIIDYSSSQFPFIKTSIAAAKALVDKLPPSDRMAIVTDDVELVQDFTRDKQKLKSKLDSLLIRLAPTITSNSPVPRFGRSQQYSALLATLNEAFNNEDQRPIVIFQTDGDQLTFLRNSPLTTVRTEQSSKRLARLLVPFSLDDICHAAEKARATIYTVIPGHQLLNRSPAEQLALTRTALKESYFFGRLSPEAQRNLAGLMSEELVKNQAENLTKMQGALAEVSTSTGGWTMFLEKPDDADHIYSSIFADINRRYLVGYYPTNKEHDGKRRKLDVKVRDHPEYVVLGRTWYYAPAADQ